TSCETSAILLHEHNRAPSEDPDLVACRSQPTFPQTRPSPSPLPPVGERGSGSLVHAAGRRGALEDLRHVQKGTTGPNSTSTGVGVFTIVLNFSLPFDG